jgi:hypothetical protein
MINLRKKINFVSQENMNDKITMKKFFLDLYRALTFFKLAIKNLFFFCLRNIADNITTSSKFSNLVKKKLFFSHHPTTSFSHLKRFNKSKKNKILIKTLLIYYFLLSTFDFINFKNYADWLNY